MTELKEDRIEDVKIKTSDIRVLERIDQYSPVIGFFLKVRLKEGKSVQFEFKDSSGRDSWFENLKQGVAE